MPEAPIPFVPNQESGLEKLGGASALAMNVVMSPNGVVHRRPGIVADGLTSGVVDSDGVVGLHSTVDGRIYAVGGSRHIYHIAGGSVQLSGVVGEKLAGTKTPIFAETEAILAIAGGNVPQKIVLASDAVSRLGGDPNHCSHVIAYASRLLTNETQTDLSKVRYSEPDAGTSYAGHELWDMSGDAGFFSAEARPDPIVALHENSNEIWAFGSTNFQTFVNDPTIVFAPSNTREYGCSAPYSIVRVDQSFAWLDHRRRFVVSDGRSLETLNSGAIQQVLDDMDTVSDCIGYRVTEGPVDVLVWCFPTDGRTFAFQMGGGWSQWGSWNETGNRWGQFPVRAHCHNTVTDQNIVGTDDGYIGCLKMGQSADLGGRIHSFIETGYLDRDTDRKKHCISVRFTMKTGQATTGDTLASVRYSDEPGVWSAPMVLSSSANDTYPVVELRSLGVYRRRAWRFEFSAPEELALVRVSEEYEVLDV